MSRGCLTPELSRPARCGTVAPETAKRARLERMVRPQFYGGTAEMHNQTDQRKSPMRAGHAKNLASRVGSGGNARSGESPDASIHHGERNGSRRKS